MKKPPKFLWAFWANMNGPWFIIPQKVTIDRDMFEIYDDIIWYDKTGNHDIKKIGLFECDGYLAFAHENKKEVQKFINGFMACRKLLSKFYV